MQLALDRARLSPAEVDYLNAHATSTPLGDRAEAQAISDTFGDRAGKLLVSSTKSMTGHLLGGAGSLEAGITVLALRDQIAPPTTNLEDADERCKFTLVRDKGLSTRISIAMTNSFGFGGTNATLIFRRWE
jgi:3-oxoacyl-[acyl-carrier-protein] synthase II